jgi:hypothetical protein
VHSELGWENLKKGDYLEDNFVDGMIILKWMWDLGLSDLVQDILF